jgi:hypothetical protein
MDNASGISLTVGRFIDENKHMSISSTDNISVKLIEQREHLLSQIDNLKRALTTAIDSLDKLYESTRTAQSVRLLRSMLYCHE